MADYEMFQGCVCSLEYDVEDRVWSPDNARPERGVCSVCLLCAGQHPGTQDWTTADRESAARLAATAVAEWHESAAPAADPVRERILRKIRR